MPELPSVHENRGFFGVAVREGSTGMWVGRCL